MLDIDAMMPVAKAPMVADKRSWSIPVMGVLVPFFTATNTQGKTFIPTEALGAPIRLAKDKDGTPRFSSSGRPVFRVVREIADQVRIMRETYIAGLVDHATEVAGAMPDEYKAQVEANMKAGMPLINRDTADLDAYFDAMKAAEAIAEPKTKTEAIVEPKTKTKPQTEKELVAA